MLQLTSYVFMMAFVAGCVKADKYADRDAGSGANAQKQFRFSKAKPVVDVTGYAENLLTSDDVERDKSRDSETDKQTGVSRRREYNLKLCGIQDIRAKNSVLGAKLKVYSELDIRNSDLTVQNNNCVYWTVSIPYNYFAEAINLEVNFVFLSQSAPKSYIHKKVLFNPWDSTRGNNPEFMDMTRNGVSDELLKQKWARGIDQLEQALKGELVISDKKLEVSSITVTAVQRNRENYVSTNNLGGEAIADLIKEEELDVRKKMQRLQPLDVHLNMLLSGLKIRLKNTAGSVSDESLKMGRYVIHAQVIATDLETKGHYIITDKKFNASDKLWNTNTIGVSALIPVSVMIRPNWGNLQLALKVIPFDIPGVEPFEALYPLGPFADVLKTQTVSFDLSQYQRSQSNGSLSFNYEDYLKSAANYADWSTGLTEKNIPEDGTLEKGFRGFQFTLLNVLFSRILPGDTATDRTIQYTVDTCLSANGIKPGKGLKFEIETEDRGEPFKLIRSTDDQGCLRWFGMISHKPYHRENLVKKVSKLRYMGSDRRGQNYELEYYINPWDEKFTFGRDARALPPEYLQQIEEQQKDAPPTKVLITHFSYDAIGFRYVVDKFMNLTVKKSVLMNIDAKVLKYNSIIWGRSGLMDLRDGIYLLKIAMQKDYLDPTAPGRAISVDKRSGQSRVKTADANDKETKQYLIVKESLVRVLGGKIVTPIEFDVTDLRTLRIRAQMFIQLETIDERLLRLAVLLDEKFSSILGHDGLKTTPEILNEMAAQEKIEKELDAANAATNSKEIQRLSKEKQASQEKLNKLFVNVDRTTVARVMQEMQHIRQMGESGVSNDRNRKYQAINETLRAQINSAKAKIDKKIKMDESLAHKDFQKNREQECQTIAAQLKADGRDDEAKLYDTEKAKDGAYCDLSLSDENKFYYLTSVMDIGSDRWFKSFLSQEEYVALKSNTLRDDFTKPYKPNYDFDLLSNEGDEKQKDENGQELGDRVSGLPRRTFIGPVTFVLNGNGSAMRPTDVLDESQCQGTCAVLNETENSIVNNSNFMKDLKEKMVRAFGNSVNDAYERSPYFGYVGHFYNKQVNDLMPMERGIKAQYYQEMKALSEVGNIIEKMNLEYVSFSNTPVSLRFVDQECYRGWKKEIDIKYKRWQTGEEKVYSTPDMPANCLQTSTDRVVSKDNYLKSINAKVSQNISMEMMKEFAKNGLMSEKLTLENKRDALFGVCSTLASQLVPRNIETLDSEIAPKLSRFAIKYVAVPAQRDFVLAGVREVDYKCRSMVESFYNNVVKVTKGITDIKEISRKAAALSHQLPFGVVRNVRVLNTSNRYIYQDGKTLNYSVGTGFSLSNSFGVNRGMKVDPLETLEKAAGLFGKTGEAVSKATGIIGGFLNFAWAQNESVSRSNGTSVSEGTTLASQISTLDIELSEWEKCVTVKFDPKFHLDAVQSMRTKEFYSTEMISALGYMLCSGDYDKEDDLNPGKPLRVRERYYYLTQIFNEGDMQDPQSLANHPWMLQIRGVRDFAIFQSALKKPDKDLNWMSMPGYAAKDTISFAQLPFTNKYGERSNMEVVNYEDEGHALTMMKEAYSRSLPTFPGMYTFSGKGDDLVNNWPLDNNNR